MRVFVVLDEARAGVPRVAIEQARRCDGGGSTRLACRFTKLPAASEPLLRFGDETAPGSVISSAADEGSPFAAAISSKRRPLIWRALCGKCSMLKRDDANATSSSSRHAHRDHARGGDEHERERQPTSWKEAL